MIGRLDSTAANLDGDPTTLETVGTLRGGIRATFAFRGFSPVPSGVLPAVQFYTATAESYPEGWEPRERHQHRGL